MTKDAFRFHLKVKCNNYKRNNSPMGHRWGCPCCVPFRMVGRNNKKKWARRYARRSLKREDRHEVTNV